MDYTRITVETRGHVNLMGLNRPEKQNAFDLEMYAELARAYGELDRNPELRCGVLFAHGKHFTSGLELDKWAPVLASGKWTVPEGCIHPLGMDGSARCKKPVVMAIQGRCYTIGFELLLAQDIRVASTDSRIALLEVKRGIYPVGGGTVRLFREIGWGNAMRYLLTGDEMTGPEALRLGLVQELTEPDKVLDRAIEIATDISRRAPLGVMAALNSARIAATNGPEAAFARLIPDLKPIMESEDAIEGVMSFIERREANFKGK
ncbi:MAG: crotonase/enoyl-CoA hydratase family protein [Deltaproteobacteria bacterium]|nr:crotonase/enoyl-CoA hydratase family protein [Deltaproteobacteria bacterium]